MIIYYLEKYINKYIIEIFYTIDNNFLYLKIL